MTIAQKLIAALLSDPDAFENAGTANALLEEYFEGFSLETLRPLLRHSNPTVQRVGVWISSELGIQASPLLEDVIPLAGSPERYIAYHALETVAVCSRGPQSGHLSLVVSSLESDDAVLRNLAMRLVGNSDDHSIEATLTFFDEAVAPNEHFKGLLLLLRTTKADRRKVVEELLGSDSATLRKYGAILARRAYLEDPELILNAAANENPDVRRYAEEVIDVLQVSQEREP